jgi:hypothetical protein
MFEVCAPTPLLFRLQVNVKNASWATPGTCATPNRCIKAVTAFVQSGRIVGTLIEYNVGPAERIGRQRGTRVTQALPTCST